MAQATGVRWQERGPPGPKAGGPSTWRGQPWREGSQRFAKRGGRNREYFAAKYGFGSSSSSSKGQGKGEGGCSSKGQGKGDSSSSSKGQGKGKGQGKDKGKGQGKDKGKRAQPKGI